MQVDSKRACPSCGEQNSLDASFCWKCFAPLGGPGPQVPPAPSVATERRPRRRITVAGAVVAVLVFVALRSFGHPSYHVPDALPGMERLHDAQSADFERRMQQEAVSNDIDLESAVYGTGNEARVYLALANGQAEEDTDQLFRGFLSGAESSGATVDRASQVNGSYQGAQWRCVPVHAASLSAAVCMWREDASVGMTLDLDPGDDLSGSLLAAYDASHA
jgi:hypothetical protein